MTAACHSPAGLARYFLDYGGIAPVCRGALDGAAAATDAAPAYYLGVFLLTCLLEAPVYFQALKASAGGKPARWQAVVLLNLATHPIVYFAVPRLVAWQTGSYAQALTLGETFAPLAEAAGLRAFWAMPWPRALLAAAAANLISWWSGIYILGWLG